MFWKLDLFPFLDDDRSNVPTLLGPLQRASLNHRATLLKVKLKVTLRPEVYRQSVRLLTKPLETYDR
jgi:hypothetical protein